MDLLTGEEPQMEVSGAEGFSPEFNLPHQSLSEWMDSQSSEKATQESSSDQYKKVRSDVRADSHPNHHTKAKGMAPSDGPQVKSATSDSIKGVLEIRPRITTRSQARLQKVASEVQPTDSVSQICKRSSKKGSHFSLRSRTTTLSSSYFGRSRLSHSQVEAILQSKSQSQQKKSDLEREQILRRHQYEEAELLRKRQREEQELERKRQEILSRQRKEEEERLFRQRKEEEERIRKAKEEEEELQRLERELRKKQQMEGDMFSQQRQREIEEFNYRCKKAKLDLEAEFNKTIAEKAAKDKKASVKRLQSEQSNIQPLTMSVIPVTQQGRTEVQRSTTQQDVPTQRNKHQLATATDIAVSSSVQNKEEFNYRCEKDQLEATLNETTTEKAVLDKTTSMNRLHSERSSIQSLTASVFPVMPQAITTEQQRSVVQQILPTQTNKEEFDYRCEKDQLETTLNETTTEKAVLHKTASMNRLHSERSSIQLLTASVIPTMPQEITTEQLKSVAQQILPTQTSKPRIATITDFGVSLSVQGMEITLPPSQTCQPQISIHNPARTNVSVMYDASGKPKVSVPSTSAAGNPTQCDMPVYAAPVPKVLQPVSNSFVRVDSHDVIQLTVAPVVPQQFALPAHELHPLCKMYADVFDSVQHQKEEFTPEPQLFLNEDKKSTNHRDGGHYEMDLTLQNPEMQIRVQEEQRVACLKRLFMKKPNLYKEYKVFVDDNPLQGPDLTNNLIGILTKFRRISIAVMREILATFLQEKISESDRNLFKFLWWEEGIIDKHVKLNSLLL